MLKQIRSLIIVLMSFTYTLVSAQSTNDDLSLKDSFKPITADNIFKTEGYYNWGTSILKTDDGKYHMFYSRWKKEYGFYGWLTHSEIAHATSKSPAGPWTYKETVLQGARENRWDAITAHNPKIKYFDGKYYLYYVGTNLGDKNFTEEELIETAHTGYGHANWKILRPNQRVGVAVANSINGPWKRFDTPLIEPSGPITTITVNPAITKAKDGNYYLIVKGDKPNEKRFIRNQAMAISKSPIGPFVIQEKPVIDYIDTEDMSMWYDEIRDRFYGVFHAHGFIGMVTSADGLHWEKAQNYELMPKEVKQEDGTKLIPDRLERPFIYHENGIPKVLGLAAKQGDESFSIFIPIE
ncbi:glycoside hydrolase family protein [Aestuariibaculum suncheonense]|uniref:Glycoside hydrolase family protein n=1 Tax=Aestuariibaculum suncheonense TaxID=1028745 RepID=A0A8J6QP77_9FLAO|nr:glycoside hydrolase family protein [Aestuariibaculum suncheonense]MBD0834204.1 glycoside hydrolase family protein [Aestuariibaculum suncheonense]